MTPGESDAKMVSVVDVYFSISATIIDCQALSEKLTAAWRGLMDTWLNEDPEDEKRETEERNGIVGFYIAAALLPLTFLFDHLGKYDLGMNLFLCLGMNAIVIRIRWELKKYVWFWVVMAIVVAAELPIVFKVKWPHQWVPAVSLLLIGLAACLVGMGAIKLAEKIMVKDPPSDEDA
jgi:hypothetical protein